MRGLLRINNFITKEQEIALLEAIDKEKWNESLKRRTQHYGFVYNYGSKEVVSTTDPIPSWCESIIDKLMRNKVFFERPDQVIVNEYLPGQGIHPHVDDIHSFDNVVCSLSLGSSIVLDMINDNNNDKNEIWLPQRSLVVLRDDARYKWKHGIAARKTDHHIKRKRRVSLTFRKMLESSKTKKMKMVEEEVS
jgi:alkylated DNA repair dioxygenase AlkB